jgi:hypothetical protein
MIEHLAYFGKDVVPVTELLISLFELNQNFSFDFRGKRQLQLVEQVEVLP